MQICTSINGHNKNIRIHRCVAETFLGNADGYEIVNHIDGNKHNNRVDNLEWVSRRGNYRHAVEHELINPDACYLLGQCSSAGYYRGSHNGRSKLTEGDVIRIRQHYINKGHGKKCNRRELAVHYGVSPGLISQIVNYKIWTHV